MSELAFGRNLGISTSDTLFLLPVLFLLVYSITHHSDWQTRACSVPSLCCRNSECGSLNQSKYWLPRAFQAAKVRRSLAQVWKLETLSAAASKIKGAVCLSSNIDNDLVFRTSKLHVNVSGRCYLHWNCAMRSQTAEMVLSSI